MRQAIKKKKKGQYNVELKETALQRHAYHSLPRTAVHAALLIAQCSGLFSDKTVLLGASCSLFWDEQKTEGAN